MFVYVFFANIQSWKGLTYLFGQQSGADCIIKIAEEAIVCVFLEICIYLLSSVHCGRIPSYRNIISFQGFYITFYLVRETFRE